MPPSSTGRAPRFRHHPPAQAPRPIGADEKVGADRMLRACSIGEPHECCIRRQVVDGYACDAKPHVAAVPFAGIGEVDKHVGLRVELCRGADQLRGSRSGGCRRRTRARHLHGGSRLGVRDRRRRSRPAGRPSPLRGSRRGGYVRSRRGDGCRSRRSRCRPRAKRWESMSPAGPAPTTPTCVRVSGREADIMRLSRPVRTPLGRWCWRESNTLPQCPSKPLPSPRRRQVHSANGALPTPGHDSRRIRPPHQTTHLLHFRPGDPSVRNVPAVW